MGNGMHMQAFTSLVPRALASYAMALAAAFLALILSTGARADSRIKDIADFEGVRDNMLVGYGLVVGLNGTGDSLTNSGFTKQSLIGMLERLGVNTRDDVLKTANVAAVMVTATLPAFARQGTRIDVAVAALGDAKSLLGGTLLVTPMIGADGEVYAVAQGQVAVGGFSAQGAAASVTKGVPDQRPHRQRRHRRARDRLPHGQSAQRAHRTAQPRPHHGAARRAGDQQVRRDADRRRDRSGDGHRQFPTPMPAAWSRC